MQFVTTWGQRWLKETSMKEGDFFYQVLLFVDAFIKVMGEDSHSDCLGI